VIWHIHGADIENMSFLKRLIYRWAARNSDGILCVSLELADWIKTLKSPDTQVWYLPNFIPETDGRLCGDLSGIPDDGCIRVACVSNLRDPKDHATLLDAWKIVLAEHPKSRLFLIGGISDEKYARKVFEKLRAPILSDRVVWLGARSDVRPLLKHCQIGVLSSRSEGFPITLLEYGSEKLGTVSTDVGQCAEILDYGQAGILVPPGNASALASALIRLISDPGSYAKLGQRLHDRIRSTYSQAAALACLTAVYEKVL
jgi:glycosyltransferase involved in cell wall biosynthesis